MRVSAGVRPMSPRPFTSTGNGVGRVHHGAHRRAAAGVDEAADLRAERQPVGAVELRHDRTIGRETSHARRGCRASPTRARRGPTRVPAAVPGRAMLPACCCAVADEVPVVGVGDLVRVRQAGVVAIQPADREVRAAEPVVREAPADRQVDARRTAAAASAWRTAPVRPVREHRRRATPSPGLAAK